MVADIGIQAESKASHMPTGNEGSATHKAAPIPTAATAAKSMRRENCIWTIRLNLEGKSMPTAYKFNDVDSKGIGGPATLRQSDSRPLEKPDSRRAGFEASSKPKRQLELHDRA
jgi:hypothetical protein